MRFDGVKAGLEIPRARGFAWRLFVGATFGALVGLALIGLGLFAGRPDALLLGAGVAATLGLMAAFAWRQARRGGAGVLVDAQGLTNGAGFAGTVFVPWQDIAVFEVDRSRSVPIVWVLLQPGARLPATQPDGRRTRARPQRPMLGDPRPSPVGIVVDELDIEVDALESLLRRHYAMRRKLGD